MLFVLFGFFFFKQKTAYEMRISDWSSDVCSSDLGYDRTWNMESVGKPVLACSNDPLLGGDPSRYNPEDLLLSALASCHMLWYLHLASNAGIIVHAYEEIGRASCRERVCQYV